MKVAPLLAEHERDSVIDSASNQIIELFKDPSSLPDKLALIIIRESGRWSSKWSWRNQLIMYMSGYTDAMTFYNWRRYAGREPLPELMARQKELGYVPGGFYILQPLKRKIWVKVTDEETGETSNVPRQYTYGYRPHYVFGLEATHVVDEALWAEWSSEDDKNHIQEIPFLNVALAWGLKVVPKNTMAMGAAGFYSSNQQLIALGVKNLATACHELVHAAEDRNGNLTKGRGQDPGNEIVAEFGGAALLKIIGLDHDADLGGAYEYVQKYARESDGDVVKAIDKVLWRVKAALALIFETAMELEQVEP